MADRLGSQSVSQLLLAICTVLLLFLYLSGSARFAGLACLRLVSQSASLFVCPVWWKWKCLQAELRLPPASC